MTSLNEDSDKLASEKTPLVSPTEVEEQPLKEGHKVHTILEDAIDTVKLGVPIFIAMLSWVGVRIE